MGPKTKTMKHGWIIQVKDGVSKDLAPSGRVLTRNYGYSKSLYNARVFETRRHARAEKYKHEVVRKVNVNVTRPTHIIEGR